MHNSGTLSCPFLRKLMPEGKKILPTKLSFETKITDIDDYYELKVRMCANGANMVQGKDYFISYAPTVDSD